MLGHVRPQVVVDELAGHALDGQFAGRIDFGEEHLVEQREAVGELLKEIAYASGAEGYEGDKS